MCHPVCTHRFKINLHRSETAGWKRRPRPPDQFLRSLSRRMKEDRDRPCCQSLMTFSQIRNVKLQSIISFLGAANLLQKCFDYFGPPQWSASGSRSGPCKPCRNTFFKKMSLNYGRKCHWIKMLLMKNVSKIMHDEYIELLRMTFHFSRWNSNYAKVRVTSLVF